MEIPDVRMPATGRDRPGHGGRIVRRGLGFGGCVGAILLFTFSLTPSLLPRHWALQGVLSGVTMAIGYAPGATVGALARAIWPRLPAPSRRAWTVLAGTGAALAVVFLWRADSWERDLRHLVGEDPAPAWGSLLIPAVAAAVFGLLLVVSRAIRLLTRRIAATLGRFSPRRVASAAAVGLVATAGYGVVQGVVLTGFVDIAERISIAANSFTSSDVARPESSYVSGGPGSLVPWDTLGRYGRRFIAGSVSVKELRAFAGSDVEEPIRVYVGRDSAPTMEEQAALAMRELERTGAFDRSVLTVVVSTGTGWVNPAVADSMEYLHAGDSALVAMQYSYLPSWLSVVADQSTATEAAKILIGAVQDRLAELPEDERPALVVYGESLGARGIEVAFGDLEELLAGTDGVLLAGPPHNSPIWQQVTEERDAGSPIWRPSYEAGKDVWFGQRPADLSGKADRPQLIYLQNASDPIVWWTPDLLFREPEWLDDPRSPELSDSMRWYPVATFWQVAVDGIMAIQAPPGHGHSYRHSIAAAWAALVPPEDWTDRDTVRLQAQLPPD